jgi:O-methyltransferase involved in polyketide biosynthesis
VIVADGLLAFLTPDDMVALLNRLIDHFPGGEVAFNGYSRFAIWAAKHYHGTKSVAALIRSPGFDDPREPERWNPRLQLVIDPFRVARPASLSRCAGRDRAAGAEPSAAPSPHHAKHQHQHDHDDQHPQPCRHGGLLGRRRGSPR